MNKKLLFGIMSLAALTACTNDDFESRQVAQEASPIQFEIINDEALTRASMDGNKIVWNVADNDLFTLYHGGAGVTGYENATYKATANEGAAATLTTPSMIKQGSAIMVWPVDTTFRIKPANNLSLQIKPYFDGVALENIENNIPYVSDLINIGAYAEWDNSSAAAIAATQYNVAGKDRKYPVVMRPMASQLILKTDYAGTDTKIAELYDGGADGLTGEDAIEPISLTSVDLQTQAAGADEFTTEIALAFSGAVGANWASVANNAWSDVTEFGAVNASTDKLTTKVLTGNESCKFLLLPQAAIAGGVDDGAVIVNTIYGKVVVAAPGVAGSEYTDGSIPGTEDEISDAWYRFLSAGTAAEAYEVKATTAGSDGKYKTTSAPADGMMQTINVFSNYTMQSATSPVKGEPVGAAATRYVKVLLSHLNMSELHIKTDKQLRDAAKVWKKMGLSDVTVYLDGNSKKEFEISQKTIKVINDINASTLPAKSFKVMPCNVGGEQCNTIVITGASEIQNVQDMTFIVKNGTKKAAVALKKGETWKWSASNTVKVAPAATCGVSQIINKGTLVSDATATIKTAEADGTQNNLPFVNDGTWNLTGCILNVQFNVTNNGTVNIAKGAQYRQDGQVQNTVFVNEATDKPSRFGGNDNKIGKVINKGVFATVAKAGTYTADINNYGLIEHADDDAKTYITRNQLSGNFGTAFSNVAPKNKMGRINLPYTNKDEDNISINSNDTQGFVSVTINGEPGTSTLNLTSVGDHVNYLIINKGVDEINTWTGTGNVKYLEVNQPGTEIAWNVVGSQTFTGLMVLSDINIKLHTTINVTGATYLGADMYVGGIFNNASWSGYYGDTTSNVDTKYITY